MSAADYRVVLLKRLELRVQADSESEAIAWAVAVADGEASPRVRARVAFVGKRLVVEHVEAPAP